MCRLFDQVDEARAGVLAVHLLAAVRLGEDHDHPIMVHPAPGDLEARLALERELLASIDRLDRAIARAMDARAKMSPAQATAMDDEVASLVMLDVHSSEADVVKPTRIREQLAFLMNSLEGAYARPTAAEYAAAKNLEGLASDGETRLAQLASQ